MSCASQHVGIFILCAMYKMKKEIAACELTALQASCAILAWISIVDETHDMFFTGDQLPMQDQTACGVNKKQLACLARADV
jgi:hypothetical protein